MPTSLFVTIAMPCLNEAAFIEACVASVRSQTYARDRIEILVADGGSTDGTCDALTRLTREDLRIRVLDNPDRIQAAGLNRILKEARGDVIVRMDVHCEYEPDYVEKCVEVLERTGADNVGGAQRCRGRTEFEKAVCAALGSPLGVGGAAYRSPDNEGYVDTVFLGAYRRTVFSRIGPWDEGAITNEDAELNQRLVAAGGRIYLSREIVVHYTPRSSLAGAGSPILPLWPRPRPDAAKAPAAGVRPARLAVSGSSRWDHAGVGAVLGDGSRLCARHRRVGMCS